MNVLVTLLAAVLIIAFYFMWAVYIPHRIARHAAFHTLPQRIAYGLLVFFIFGSVVGLIVYLVTQARLRSRSNEFALAA